MDVNNKHVPFKKTRMTIEGRSNVEPVMTLLVIRFTGGYSDILIISILDYHVKAIVAGSRDTQHIPRLGWVCAFFIFSHVNKKTPSMKKQHCF